MSDAKPVKTYVPVQVLFDKYGNMKPSALAWEDGTVFTIDRVLTVRQAAAMKAGGQGDRYTIRIKGKETYLFFEHSTDGNRPSIFKHPRSFNNIESPLSFQNK